MKPTVAFVLIVVVMLVGIASGDFTNTTENPEDSDELRGTCPNNQQWICNPDYQKCKDCQLGEYCISWTIVGGLSNDKLLQLMDECKLNRHPIGIPVKHRQNHQCFTAKKGECENRRKRLLTCPKVVEDPKCCRKCST